LIICFDLVRFTNRLNIDITDGAPQSVELIGCGEGSALVTIPVLPKCVNVGPQYCGHVGQYQFIVLNKGRKKSSVKILTEGFNCTLYAKVNLLWLWKYLFRLITMFTSLIWN